MSLFSKLLGRGKSAPEPEAYNGFRIFPEPVKESGGYRLAARIEKEIDGEVKTHEMIRADMFNSLEQANEGTITKAKMMIDQMGDRIFG